MVPVPHHANLAAVTPPKPFSRPSFCHLCGWMARIPGGTRQHDGLETGIMGGYGREIGVALQNNTPRCVRRCERSSRRALASRARARVRLWRARAAAWAPRLSPPRATRAPWESACLRRPTALLVASTWRSGAHCSGAACAHCTCNTHAHMHAHMRTHVRIIGAHAA